MKTFNPEGWFMPSARYVYRCGAPPEAGIPDSLRFQTKVELAWQMIQRAQENGLPFEFVACDDLYGRANWFRAAMEQAHIIYMADVPRTTRVYLTCPT